MSDEFNPLRPGDLADPNPVAGELRALRVEMRGWFEIVINRLERHDTRVTALEEARDYIAERITDHEKRIAALEAAAAKEPKP